ncbi:MAG: IS607 family transposase [Deltaproteobacteria bacterium]|nr:IS607 family transposase [Deltaproteobacteria bacterium]
MAYVNTREAVRSLGVHPNTLRSWANAGKIKHIKTPSGQRRYNIDAFLGERREAATVCYCRVSSYKQKDDLERQVKFMRERFPDATIVKDIGSGINFKRRGLLSILDQAMRGDRIRLISAHRDRLCRFGFDLIKWIIEHSNGEVLVLDQTNLSPEQELTNDLLTILHVFSCRMHGLRSYKNKIAKAFAHKKPEGSV